MRASFAFGSAGLILAVFVFFWVPHGLFLFPIAGLVVSLLIHRGTQSGGQRFAAGGIAAAAFGFTGVAVCFSLISLQADIEPVWGAFAWGLGFGIAGIVSGRSLCRLWCPRCNDSSQVRFAGLISGSGFALSGAISGYLAFLAFSSWNLAALAAGIWLAFQLGGFLCDAGWRLSIRGGDRTLRRSGLCNLRCSVRDPGRSD